MNKTVILLLLLAAVSLSACISVPDEHRTVSQRGPINVVQTAHDCGSILNKNMAESGAELNNELNSGGFQLLTWNILKGWKEGWKEDFELLTRYKDIVTLQEARLNNELRDVLKKGEYNWDISTAFQYNDAAVGVLTASRLKPDLTCTFRVKEPLINLPKTVLVTLYPLSNTDKTLMVVNIHSINFTLGTESFIRQLQEVEKAVVQHQGPVIFSGDVNTWSSKRMEVLKALSIRLGLKAVPFNRDTRTKVFGHMIDHVYYRDLTIREASVIKVTSSDHNPMLVSFRLEESR